MSKFYEHETPEPREGLLQFRLSTPGIGENPLLVKPYSSSFPAQDPSLWDRMEKYLSRRELSVEIAKSNGWYPSSTAGDTSPRIVIPATSGIKGNNFWQARALDDNPKRYQSPHGVSRGDAVILVSAAGENVPDELAVVEGPMDALAAASAGYDAVALMGNTPPPEVLKLLSTLEGKAVLVSDCDAPEEMVSVMKQLVELGMSVRLVETYPWKDLAEVPEDTRRLVLA